MLSGWKDKHCSISRFNTHADRYMTLCFQYDSSSCRIRRKFLTQFFEKLKIYITQKEFFCIQYKNEHCISLILRIDRNAHWHGHKSLRSPLVDYFHPGRDNVRLPGRDSASGRGPSLGVAQRMDRRQ
jgi:hypothetical protein